MVIYNVYNHKKSSCYLGISTVEFLEPSQIRHNGVNGDFQNWVANCPAVFLSCFKGGRGGGGLNPKIYVADFGPLVFGLFEHKIDKKNAT